MQTQRFTQSPTLYLPGTEVIFAVDRQARLIMLNEVAERELGVKSKTVLGRPYQELFHFVGENSLQEGLDPILAVTQVGESRALPTNLKLQRPNGQQDSVFGRVYPFGDQYKQRLGAIVVFRDVSFAQELDRIKSEFVSVVSHQLRTPLTAIKLFSEMLLQTDVGKLNDRQEEYIHDIERSTERMIKLVNDLLNVSRLEAGRLQVQPQLIQLEDFIQEVIQDIQPIASAWNCEIIFEPSRSKLPRILIDVNLMRQVIYNLLSNAIKYSKRGRAQVIVRLVKQNQDYLISVQDFGIGISKLAQAQIFSKFFRSDEAIKANPEGSGLGLFLAKMMMETSGGKLWFESEPQIGTTFFIQLPLAGMSARHGNKDLAA